jgi:DNA polymerase/3'-5' exonuclease PolX
MSIPLRTAERIAAKVVSGLGAYSEQILVAGSIRRKRPMVSDVNLVVEPKVGQIAALRERCQRNALRVQALGEMALMVYIDYPPGNSAGFLVDVWTARPTRRDLFGTSPTNFGSLLLYRTGSRTFCEQLSRRAASLGLRWDPTQGVFRGEQCIASATEHDVLTALQLEFIPAELREQLTVDHCG